MSRQTPKGRDHDRPTLGSLVVISVVVTPHDHKTAITTPWLLSPSSARPYGISTGDDDGIASDDLAQRGQRIATALIRLNQEFTGGDTVFPRLETRWSGVRGDALTFINTLPDLRGDPRTLHKGEPVETGMKILVSLWLREHA